MKQVRMLTDYPVFGVTVPANTAPVLPDATADAIIAVGAADDDPGAVAYAVGLGLPVPEGLPTEPEPAEPEPAEPAPKGAKG